MILKKNLIVIKERMMTVGELKAYIYDNDKVRDILEAIGCHHIRFHKEKSYWSCANCDGDNETAINVRQNEGLNVKNYTRDNKFDERSDIFTLVQYNLGVQKKPNSFYDAIKFVHSVLGLKFSYKKEEIKQQQEKPDPLMRFKMIKRRNQICIANDYDALNESVINNYVPYPHISFAREGIMPWTWKKFGIGYSYHKQRTVIPLRYWLTGELLGFNMRTSVENYDVLGIKKYWITPGYPKQINLYGLWENKEEISKSGHVTVFEAEKSVLKRDTLGDYSCVAVSGHAISREQQSVLIGLGVEIVIAFDKDIDIDYLRYCCEQFYRIRRVSYIYDKNGLLSEKDSPADARNKVYKYLFDNRVVYDEKEHIEYLKSLRISEEV